MFKTWTRLLALILSLSLAAQSPCGFAGEPSASPSTPTEDLEPASAAVLTELVQTTIVPEAADNIQHTVDQIAQIPTSGSEIEKIHAATTPSLLLLFFGQGRWLKSRFKKIIERLSIVGDEKDFSISVSGSPLPNASIYPSIRKMTVTAGLLFFVRNWDELAGVLAHEMTHANSEQLKAQIDNPAVLDIIRALPEYSDLEPDQREEIRADLGAVERLIRAGYNPWSYYDFERRLGGYENKFLDMKIARWLYKKFDSRGLDYMKAHPASELRASAVKAYIMHRALRTDVSDIVGSYEKFEPAFRILQARISGWVLFFTSRAVQYGVLGANLFMIYEIVGRSAISLFLTDSKAAKAVNESIDKMAPTVSNLKVIQSVQSLAEQINVASDPLKNVGAQVASTAAKGMSYLNPAQYMPVVTANSASRAFEVGAPYVIGLCFLAAASLAALLAGIAYLDSRTHNAMSRVRMLAASQVELIAAIRNGVESGKIEESDVVKSIENVSESWKELEKIYNRPDWVANFREINSLTYTYYKSILSFSHFIKLLIEVEKVQDSKLSNAVNDALSSLPSIVFETGALRRSLRALMPLVDTKVVESAKLERQSDEPLWYYRLRLIDLFQKSRDFSIKDKISLAVNCEMAGLRKYSHALIGNAPAKMLNWLTSSENTDTQLALDFVALFDAIKKDRDKNRGLPVWYNRLTSEFWLNFEALRARFLPLAKGLAIQSHISTLQPSLGVLNPRGYMDASMSRSLEARLATQYPNVRALDQFFEGELKARNPNMDWFRGILNRLASTRSDLFQSEEDINIVLGRDYYWPLNRAASYTTSDAERPLLEAMDKYFWRFPNIWKYDPAAAEVVQINMFEALRRLGKMPTDVHGLTELWKRFTNRTVTTVTDSLFNEIYEKASLAERIVLEDLAINEGRIWEKEIRFKIAKDRLLRMQEFTQLRDTRLSKDSRRSKIELIVARLRNELQDGGIGYWDLLEFLSNEIMSTEEESRYIHAQKRLDLSGDKQEDLSLRIMSSLFTEIYKWSKSEQWDMLLFLRGDIAPTPKITATFSRVGPRRVKRVFDLLPQLVRTGLIDSFIDSDRGLLKDGNVKSGYGAKMIEQVMAGKQPSERHVAEEVLNAFLFALEKTGNTAMRSFVLSYLFSIPKDSLKSAGEVLKSCLEIFGPTGVKLGQFMAAAELLPEAETKILRGLQEKAKEPLREEMYQDIREIFNVQSGPYHLENLLGAASIKYGVKAGNKVLKIFRLEAIAHTRMEFKLLDEMVKYLIQLNGKKYYIFGSVARASRRAVERELQAESEVARTNQAAPVYARYSKSGAKFSVPKEELKAPRLIESEFIPGTSFFNLTTPQQTIAAQKILAAESDILFGERPETTFDPDRHAGNIRLKVGALPATLSVGEIDFGQLLNISDRLRSEVIELFALAQVEAHAGSHQWTAERVAEALTLKPKEVAALAKALAQFFPDTGMRPMTAYYGLLTAIESARGHAMDIGYYDFVRAMVQLKQYESVLPENRIWKTPRELFEERVRVRVDQLKVGGIRFSFKEKVRAVTTGQISVQDCAAMLTSRVRIRLSR